MLETSLDYLELNKFNMQIAEKSIWPAISGLCEFHNSHTKKFTKAFFNSLFGNDGENIKNYFKRHSDVMY